MKTDDVYRFEGKCGICSEYIVPVREEVQDDGEVLLICRKCDLEKEERQ